MTVYFITAITAMLNPIADQPEMDVKRAWTFVHVSSNSIHLTACPKVPLHPLLFQTHTSVLRHSNADDQ
jgi:hypothetical protein